MFLKNKIKIQFNYIKIKRFSTGKIREISEFEIWVSNNSVTNSRNKFCSDEWDLNFYLENFYNWYHFYLFFINFRIYCREKNIKIDWGSSSRSKTINEVVLFRVWEKENRDLYLLLYKKTGYFINYSKNPYSFDNFPVEIILKNMEKFYSFSLSDTTLHILLMSEKNLFTTHLDFVDFCVRSGLKEGLKEEIVNSQSFLKFSRICTREQMTLEFTIIFLNFSKNLRNFNEKNLDLIWKSFENSFKTCYPYSWDLLYQEIKFYFSLGLSIDNYIFILKMRQSILKFSLLAINC